MKSNAEKTTLVLGASDNPERTSYTALHMLRAAGVPVLAVGLKEAQVGDVEIHKGTDWILGQPIHTVTLYMNATRQKELEAFILGLSPKRIIFNPGAENESLFASARSQGIVCENACTLVMLNFGQF